MNRGGRRRAGAGAAGALPEQQRASRSGGQPCSKEPGHQRAFAKWGASLESCPQLRERRFDGVPVPRPTGRPVEAVTDDLLAVRDRGPDQQRRCLSAAAAPAMARRPVEAPVRRAARRRRRGGRGRQPRIGRRDALAAGTALTARELRSFLGLGQFVRSGIGRHGCSFALNVHVCVAEMFQRRDGTPSTSTSTSTSTSSTNARDQTTTITPPGTRRPEEGRITGARGLRASFLPEADHRRDPLRHAAARAG
jgi:hypothetical protein